MTFVIGTLLVQALILALCVLVAQVRDESFTLAFGYNSMNYGYQVIRTPWDTALHAGRLSLHLYAPDVSQQFMDQESDSVREIEAAYDTGLMAGQRFGRDRPPEHDFDNRLLSPLAFGYGIDDDYYQDFLDDEDLEDDLALDRRPVDSDRT